MSARTAAATAGRVRYRGASPIAEGVAVLFEASDDALYDALMTRDPSYDGRAFVGVTSTGVFCRLTCPARKPKRENCRFFASVGACIEAGFRPCRRCHPLGPAATQTR